jgi:hypothetical protein
VILTLTIPVARVLVGSPISVIAAKLDLSNSMFSELKKEIMSNKTLFETNIKNEILDSDQYFL